MIRNLSQWLERAKPVAEIEPSIFPVKTDDVDSIVAMDFKSS
jgi:hypothetical protein